jgi:hypothetical protein
MKKMLYCNTCDILTDHTDTTCMITEKKKLVSDDTDNTGSQDDSTSDCDLHDTDETGSQDYSTEIDDVSTDKTGSQDDSTSHDEQRMELSHEEYLLFDYTNFQDDDGIRVTLGIEDETDYPIFIEKEKLKELAEFLKQVSKKLLTFL